MNDEDRDIWYGPGVKWMWVAIAAIVALMALFVYLFRNVGSAP